jgi:hypothetical protein
VSQQSNGSNSPNINGVNGDVRIDKGKPEERKP